VKLPEDPFKSTRLLRETLAHSGHCSVLHEKGFRWEASFDWHPSASAESLDRLAAQLGASVPEAYLTFLRYSNGATLYRDPVYGQWGHVLYSTETLVTKRSEWREWYEVPDHYLVFAESLGDGDLLLLDLRSRSFDGYDAYVVYAEENFGPTKWEPIERSFHEWLDHLIVAQGAKYWTWGL
jgi:hypothetical protein